MTRNALRPLVFLAAAVTLFTTAMPLCASEADGQIESAFKKSYVSSTYLKDDTVKAEVKNGVVTLTGNVSDQSHKDMAEDTAANLPGVVRVDNKLAIKGKNASEKGDSWIESKVKLSLMFHRNVNATKTDVEVSKGVVTLKGTAENAAQKELTSEYAKDIDGVKEVKNEMTVGGTPEKKSSASGEKIDDASISAQAKMALFTHQSTSALKTKVVTRDGEITVSGTAKNEAEKTLVSKLLEDIHGVTSVKNQMTVGDAKAK